MALTQIWTGASGADASLTAATDIRGVEATNSDNTTLGQVTCFIKKAPGSLVGTVYCRLYTDASSITVVETSSLTLTDSDLTTSYQDFTFPFTNLNAIHSGYRVGIEYDDTGTVYMQKDISASGSPSGLYSALHYDSGSWGGLNPNQNYNMKLFTGGASASTTFYPPPPAYIQL